VVINNKVIYNYKHENPAPSVSYNINKDAQTEINEFAYQESDDSEDDDDNGKIPNFEQDPALHLREREAEEKNMINL
jgi:hypothetical protein